MHIHFIAIGGSAMHNLALALHQKGEKVTGSDDAFFEPSKSRLEKQGLLPEKTGWFPEKITKDTGAVILGMHAKADNPELIKARELGLEIFSYPEFLYEHSKQKTRVVIGGSHGKTTITAMILHVLHYHDKEVDFMVGAQLQGFDTMVHLTEENDFILLEGDEYLSSVLDPRPKFHLYKPNIALLSGIAWDHINVFPTFENYVGQFEIFIDSLMPGGILVYNEEDAVLREIVNKSTRPTRKQAYRTPAHHIENLPALPTGRQAGQAGGTTFLETPEGPMPISVFGEHNLNNLAGAKWICQLMGVDEADFYEAIATFTGAAKRMEKITETGNCTVFKDFAHSPSKVSATVKAVKDQYPNRKLIACLELHTYSSLNPEFLKEYQNSLDVADEAIVFYSPEAVEMKKLAPVSEEIIFQAFARKDLEIFTDPDKFQDFLKKKDFKNSVLLLMSSGNYGGLDFEAIKDWI